MTEQLPSNEVSCQNCGSSLRGDYCENCGQKDKESRRPFLLLIQEFVFVVLDLDGRAYRTLWYLFSKPAFLSLEYANGRRASYTPPLRLFLVVSIGFFLLVSLANSIQSIRVANEPETASPPAAEAVSDVELSSGINISFDDDDGDDVAISNGDLSEIEDAANALMDMRIPFITGDMDSALDNFFRSQIEANSAQLIDDPAGFMMESLEYVTILMLMMMPVLALMQQILYFTHKRFYVEHFIFTLHNHTFFLLAIFVVWSCDALQASGIPFIGAVFGIIGTAVNVWIFVYLFLSLKNFFKQGYAMTFFKYATLSFIYLVCTGFGVAAFVILFFLFS